MRLKAFYSAAIIALALIVAGCGIKPGKLDPPPNAVPDTFPRTYPNPAADAK